MIIFIKILLAHILGDFLLQPKSWVIEKEKKKAASPKLYFHVLIHGILVMVFLWNFQYWLLALLVLISHFLIDWAKLEFQTKKSKTAWFIADQILHVAVLISLALIWDYPQTDRLWKIEEFPVWTVVTAVSFLSFGVPVIMNALLEPWSSKIADGPKNSLPNAGKYIGILERLLVFVFILTDHWEGVGFLIAAKSVFRFGDLKESKDRKLTEYILIGTLLSFAMAITTALACIYLIKTFSP
ncbi:DUF3307 domain-containing protein [Aquiflexum gelatinilyticum]|uniref:DUF3307 domain-containing protein n=1 Tax=Aquiflexum gelatinilyticum TaxID=2961943 RepID=UPI00216A7864|nr:DUF3307 domain-containing protein [Aquiflexum gelatinilyticum]MCS4433163.1 DUF3307 domain-containing protein [Aquiflexum gelatinilyticum]